MEGVGRAPGVCLTDARAIVGIEIPIDGLAGKWKVSQNRSDEDKRGVAAGLSAAGGDKSVAMSALVERYRCAQR